MISIMIPPVSDCFMPTLGASQIAAYLMQQNIPVKLYDLSAELQVLLIQKGDTQQEAKFKRNESLISRYTAATNTLFCADSVSFKISYDNFTSCWNWKIPEELPTLLSTHKELIPYIKQLPSISRIEASTYLAFSISFESQIVPSLLIAAWLCRQKKLPVIFGGSFFYNYAQHAMRLLAGLDLIDCLIVGPGEKILESIYKYGIKDTARSNQFIAKDIFKNVIIQQKPSDPCPLVYLPDFIDIDFSRYLSSVKAFPYMIRNTCYYGKCHFCNGDRDCGIVQNKDIKKAFFSMEEIAKVCDVYNVYIVDAAISPNHFYKISTLDIQTSISWIANARFEKALEDESLLKHLRNNGCYMLRFGLESGSQQVLDLMNKGTKISTASSIIKKLHSSGILTHVYIMFGYPGETKYDRIDTIKFLEQNKSYITSYSISIFQPIPNTPIYDEICSRISPQLSSIAEDEYQMVLDMVYKSESEYNDIIMSIECVKNILAKCSFTNSEFYSANIFSNNTFHDDVNNTLSIQFNPDLRRIIKR